MKKEILRLINSITLSIAQHELKTKRQSLQAQKRAEKAYKEGVGNQEFLLARWTRLRKGRRQWTAINRFQGRKRTKEKRDEIIEGGSAFQAWASSD